jgi:hypothetical protein
VCALGYQSGLRLTRHPLVLSGTALAAYLILETLREHNPVYTYQSFTITLSFAMGPMIIVAAYLMTGREHRAGSGDLVTAAPMPERTRVAAVLLGCAGPAALSAGLVVATLALYLLRHAEPLRWPGPAELAIQPVRLLGAGLLGVMVARWFRGWPQLLVAVCLVTLALVAVDRFVTGPAREVVLATIPFHDLVQHQIIPTWNVAYLLSLDAMAVIGALLATPGRRRGLLAAGAIAVSTATATAVLQMR